MFSEMLNGKELDTYILLPLFGLNNHLNGQNDHLSGINDQLSRNGVLQCSMLEWCLTWTK